MAWEGRVGEERGGKSYGGARNKNARKIAPKCSIFGIMGTPFGSTVPCHTSLGDVHLMA